MLVAVACHNSAQIAQAPSLVTKTALAESPVTKTARVPCALPHLPGPIAPAVGYPTSDGIFVSKSDWLALADWALTVNAWLVAAQSCMGGER